MAILVLNRYLQIVGETVTISFARPNYYVPSIAALLGVGNLRGADRPAPGSTNGVLLNPRRTSVTQFALPLVIDGNVDDNGDPEVDPATAVVTTHAFLLSELVEGGAGGTLAPSRAATLQPSGLTGTVRVLDIDPDDDQRDAGPNIMRCSLVLDRIGRFS